MRINMLTIGVYMYSMTTYISMYVMYDIILSDCWKYVKQVLTIAYYIYMKQVLIKDDIDDYVECELSDDVSNDGDTPVLWEVRIIDYIRCILDGIMILVMVVVTMMIWSIVKLIRLTITMMELELLDAHIESPIGWNRR